MQELVITNIFQHMVEACSRLKQIKSLKYASIGLGSIKRNKQVAEILGYPLVPEIKPAERYITPVDD